LLKIAPGTVFRHQTNQIRVFLAQTFLIWKGATVISFAANEARYTGKEALFHCAANRQFCKLRVKNRRRNEPARIRLNAGQAKDLRQFFAKKPVTSLQKVASTGTRTAIFSRAS